MADPADSTARRKGVAGLTLTIDLDALGRNWRALAALAAPAECAAVVKADAYGLGIEKAVPALWAAGCRTFFVALPEEGGRVGAAAPEATIYVLGGFFAEAAALYRSAALRPVLNHSAEVAAWVAQCSGSPSALHVDTGMNRLGLTVEQGLAMPRALVEQAGVKLLMSHFACADEPGHPLNKRQMARFAEVRAAHPWLPASLANSAGILLGNDAHCDLVRPGIALYGAESAPRRRFEVVVTAQARILQARPAKAGGTVGYGATETLKRDSRIAILAAGYADGYLRSAGSNDARQGARVWIAGHPAPLLGRVSMDLMAADVTDIPGPIEPGDEAELFGPNVAVDDVAGAAGSIAYELLTGLSRRAERRYIGA